MKIGIQMDGSTFFVIFYLPAYEPAGKPKVAHDTYQCLHFMTKQIRLLTLTLAATLAFTACDRDDAQTPSNPSVPDGEKRLEWVESFQYEHHQYDEYTSSRLYRDKFSWENGLLKRWEIFDIDNHPRGYLEPIYEDGKTKELRQYTASGVMEESITFFYTGDRLTRAHSVAEWGATDYTFEYNAAGELVKQTRTREAGSTSTELYTWENGNVVKMVDQYDSYVKERVYEYDDKPNVLRHVYKDIAYIGTITVPMLSKNNVVKFSKSDNEEGRNTYTHTNTYTYDGDHVTSSTYIGGSYAERQFFRYTDGSGMAAQVCRIRFQDGYDDESRPYYVRGKGDYLKGDKVVIGTDSYYVHNGTYYTFSHWDDGNTDNPRTFTATGDATFRPVYTEGTPGRK